MNIKKYPYIDSLRGIAILAVLLVHSAQAAMPVSSPLNWFMQNGARGVQLFFITSAITFSMSWGERVGSERFTKLDFYLRRFFRIAPMFYVAILIYLFLDGYGERYWAPNGIEGWMIIATFSFLHGLHPESINSVVPGGWSIAVEMMFYALFPFIITKAKNMGAITILFIASLIFMKDNYGIVSLIFSYPESQKYLLGDFSFLNFLNQLPVFLIGIFTYMYMKRGVDKSAFYFIGGWLFIALCLDYRAPTFVSSFLSSHVVASILFAVFAIFLSVSPLKIFVNFVTVYLGKVSYSMYLLQFAILQLFGILGVSHALSNSNIGSGIHFLLLVLVTALIASVSFRFIERPGIRLGEWVISKINSI